MNNSFSFNLDRLCKEDALSISIALLYSLRGLPQYSVLSELPYIIDYTSFINLVKYYGGMTIRIPSIEEVNKVLRSLLLHQYYCIEKQDWTTAMKSSGYSSSEEDLAKSELRKLHKILKSQEIGGRHYE